MTFPQVQGVNGLSAEIKFGSNYCLRVLALLKIQTVSFCLPNQTTSLRGIQTISIQAPLSCSVEKQISAGYTPPIRTHRLFKASVFPKLGERLASIYTSLQVHRKDFHWKAKGFLLLCHTYTWSKKSRWTRWLFNQSYIAKGQQKNHILQENHSLS